MCHLFEYNKNTPILLWFSCQWSITWMYHRETSDGPKLRAILHHEGPACFKLCQGHESQEKSLRNCFRLKKTKGIHSQIKIPCDSELDTSTIKTFLGQLVETWMMSDISMGPMHCKGKSLERSQKDVLLWQKENSMWESLPFHLTQTCVCQACCPWLWQPFCPQGNGPKNSEKPGWHCWATKLTSQQTGYL